MKYRDNVIQKCISKEILSINEELYLLFIVDSKSIHDLLSFIIEP